MLLKIAVFLMITTGLMAAESVAFVKSSKGECSLQRENVTRTLSKGEKLYEHDLIQTGSKASVGISFNDGTRIALGSKTLFTIDEYLFEPSKKDFRMDLSLKKGTAVFESGKIGKLAPEKVKFKVSQGVVGIRGTKFLVEAE